MDNQNYEIKIEDTLESFTLTLVDEEEHSIGSGHTQRIIPSGLMELLFYLRHNALRLFSMFIIICKFKDY